MPLKAPLSKERTEMSTEPEKQPELPLAAPQVPASVEEPSPTPELSPRARAEREVWARSNKERAIEAAVPLPPAAGEEPAPEATAPAEAAPGEPAAAPSGDEPAPAADDPEIELLVNGKPMKVKQSQILDAGRRTLQKDAAADMKLEIASKLLREAEERTGKQPSPSGDAQPPAEPLKAVQEKSDADLAELLQYGTKEQAASAIAEIRRRDSGAVDQKGLQEFISRQLPDMVSTQLAFHSAVREAQAEYKDIFADPHLTTLFHVQEHRLRQAGDARPHAELYKEIGSGIRTHFKLPVPAKDTGPTLEQKRDLKAATPAVPRAAAARVDPGDAGKKVTPEEARERAMEAMRKSRGQQNGLKKYL
jgi:hypothetical protein